MLFVLFQQSLRALLTVAKPNNKCFVVFMCMSGTSVTHLYVAVRYHGSLVSNHLLAPTDLLYQYITRQALESIKDNLIYPALEYFHPTSAMKST